MFEGNFLQTETDAQAASAQRNVRLDQISEEIEKYFFNLDLGVALGAGNSRLKKSEKAEILGAEFLREGGELPITLGKRAATAMMRSGNELQKREARATLERAIKKSVSLREAMESSYEPFADLASDEEDRQVQSAIECCDTMLFLDLLSGLYARSVSTERVQLAPVGR